MEAPSGNNKHFFASAEPGGLIRADEYNKLTSAVSRLTSSPNVHPKHYSRVRLIRLGETVMGSQNRDNQLNGTFQFMHHSGEDASDHSSQSNDLGAGFKVSERDPLDNFADPFNLIYDRHEVLLAAYSEQAQKWLPVTPRMVRHAITCRDENNHYPVRDENPDTYAIQFVRIRYHEASGRQGHDLSYLSTLDDSVDNSSLFSEDGTVPTKPDGYVHNINRYGYIPRGSLIEVYNTTGQWFTHRLAEQNLIVRPQGDAIIGDSVRCKILSSGSVTGQTVMCVAYAAPVYRNNVCVAWQEESSGNYYVAPWECADGVSESSFSRSDSSQS